MEGALSGIRAVIVIFALIGAGLFVSSRKWVTPDMAKAFPRIIINIAMPCTVVSSLYGNFVAAGGASDVSSRAELIEPWIPLLISFAALIVSFLFALLAAWILRIPRARRGVFTVLFTFSNSVFIGFPVAQALFGDPGMTYAVYYYIANTTCFWTIGYIMIRRDADFLRGETSKIGAAEILKKLATPPLIAILAMFGVILAGLRLPGVVLEVCRYGGALTTPLSLLFTGCMIYEAGLMGVKYERGIGAVLAGRFVLTPALCFAICLLAVSLLPGSVSQARSEELILMRNVLIVQTGLPVMTQSVIVSQHYGADVRFATRGMVWTALASLLTIPLTVLLFEFL
jgi:Predicted permeases